MGAEWRCAHAAAFSLDFGTTWQSPQLSYVQSVSAGGNCSFYVIRQPSTDVVVTKTGAWSTYLGGSDADTPVRLALDSSGNTYVLGNTTSPDFPATLPRIGPVGPNAIFLAKLTPTGAVAFSVLIGAEQNNIGTAVAVSSAGGARLLLLLAPWPGQGHYRGGYSRAERAAG